MKKKINKMKNKVETKVIHFLKENWDETCWFEIENINFVGVYDEEGTIEFVHFETRFGCIKDECNVEKNFELPLNKLTVNKIFTYLSYASYTEIGNKIFGDEN